MCYNVSMIKPKNNNYGQWLKDNWQNDKNTLYNRIEKHDYIKNTLNLKNLRAIKIPMEKMDELARLMENKGIIKVMRILMGLGIKKI